MELNIIIHGRSGSTLFSEMLLITRQFNLWGDRGFANELKAFKQPEMWNEYQIQKHLDCQHGQVLAKLPEFAYFVEFLLHYRPKIFIMERSIPERVRSLAAVGWLNKANERYEEKGLHEKALVALFKCSGYLYEWDELNAQEKAAVVLGWGSWRVRDRLSKYPDKWFISFDDLILRKHDIYRLLDEIYHWPSGKYWPIWDTARAKDLQKNGRKNLEPDQYLEPYEITFDKFDIIAQIIGAFEGMNGWNW